MAGAQFAGRVAEPAPFFPQRSIEEINSLFSRTGHAPDRYPGAKPQYKWADQVTEGEVLKRNTPKPRGSRRYMVRSNPACGAVST